MKKLCVTILSMMTIWMFNCSGTDDADNDVSSKEITELKQDVLETSLDVLSDIPSAEMTPPDDVEETLNETITPPLTPVYVTLAGHIEQGKWYSDCKNYPGYRDKLRAFAELMKEQDVPFNMQVDYELFQGVVDCDTPEMMAETGGVNTFEYLATACDFEFDPHQGGGWEFTPENYADVRFMGGKATDKITETVGGVVWNQQAQFDRFTKGEKGVIHKNFTWFPQILTLGVHADHHQGDFSLDDLTGGVWIPKGFDADFLTHDPQGTMVYVGPGMQHSDWNDKGDCYFKSAADYAILLTEYLKAGTLPAGEIYTTTIAIPQSLIFFPEEHHKLVAQIQQLKPLVETGAVIFVTYTDLVEIWKSEYDSRPNILTFDKIQPADYTCP